MEVRGRFGREVVACRQVQRFAASFARWTGLLAEAVHHALAYSLHELSSILRVTCWWRRGSAHELSARPLSCTGVPFCCVYAVLGEAVWQNTDCK